MSREDKIAALAAEVATLRHTVETLADILVRAGTISDSERRDLVRAARRSREVSVDDDDVESEPPQRALVGSPYRGASPTIGVGCALCGKALADDDPDLTLGKHGKVCTMCFTRGG